MVSASKGAPRRSGQTHYVCNTCHSSGAYSSRLVKDASDANIVVFSATDKDTEAQETSKLGHGVFTYALLAGLQQAEGNAQNEILITRLAEFVQSRVPAITEEKWHYRQLPLSKIEGDPFPITRKPAN